MDGQIEALGQFFTYIPPHPVRVMQSNSRCALPETHGQVPIDSNDLPRPQHSCDRGLSCSERETSSSRLNTYLMCYDPVFTPVCKSRVKRPWDLLTSLALDRFHGLLLSSQDFWPGKRSAFEQAHRQLATGRYAPGFSHIHDGRLSSSFERVQLRIILAEEGLTRA